MESATKKQKIDVERTPKTFGDLTEQEVLDEIETTPRGITMVDRAWCEKAYARVKSWREIHRIRCEAFEQAERELSNSVDGTVSDAIRRVLEFGRPAGVHSCDYYHVVDMEIDEKDAQLKNAWEGYPQYIQDQVAGYWEEVVRLQTELYHRLWFAGEHESILSVDHVKRLCSDFYDFTKKYPFFAKHRKKVLNELMELHDESIKYRDAKAREEHERTQKEPPSKKWLEADKRDLDELEAKAALALCRDAHATKLELANSETTINGDVLLAYCERLTTLPKGMHIKGNLRIRDCIVLKELPENLRVDGFVSLQDCPQLCKLSEGLTARRLSIRRCPALLVIPKGLSSKYLGMRFANSPFAIAEGAGPFEEVNAYSAEVFPTLPRRLQCVKFDASYAKALRAFPDSSQFEGLETLNLSYVKTVTSIDKIPHSLRTLLLGDCSALEMLPPNLENVRYLDVSACIRLKTIPESLFSKERKTPFSLMAFVSGVVGLPEELSKITELQLPESVQRVPKISFSSESKLGLRLPKSLGHFSWFLLEQDRLSISLYDSPLSETQVDWLLSGDLEKIGIPVRLGVSKERMYFKNAGPRFECLTDAFEFWKVEYTFESSKNDKFTLMRFLDELVTAKECIFTEVLELVRAKVQAMAALLEESESVRGAIVNRLQVPIGKRHDQPVLTLLELAGIAQLARAESLTGPDSPRAMTTAKKSLQALQHAHKDSLVRSNSALHAIYFESYMQNIPVLGQPLGIHEIPKLLKSSELHVAPSTSD